MSEEPRLKSARNELERWGRWWRWRETAHCHQGGASPSDILLEACRLGVRVQKTNAHARIHCVEAVPTPKYVARIDALLDRLPIEQRKAVVLWYGRNIRRGRRSLELLRGELTIGKYFGPDDIASRAG